MRLFALALLPLAVLAGPAVAQNRAAGAASPEIIVQGQKDREQQVKSFVDALTRAPSWEQISRFEAGVCPAAAGLTPAQNQVVVARMRRVAKAAGMRVAVAGKCKPNALVLVTGDKQALIDALRKAHPAFFTDMFHQRIPVPNQPGPATAWQVDGRVQDDGRDLPMNEFANYYLVEVNGASPRIRPSSRPQFIASVLVVEVGALAGLTTTQLADYAAMRTFARTDPARLPASSPPTILKVLEAPMDSEVPVTLTQLDLSFLKALYGTSPEYYSNRQRREMQRMVKKDLEAAPNR
jgi:hypothetical protein